MKKATHFVYDTSTMNGTVPMTMTLCGRLVSRGHAWRPEFYNGDLVTTYKETETTCGTCEKALHQYLGDEL